MYVIWIIDDHGTDSPSGGIKARGEDIRDAAADFVGDSLELRFAATARASGLLTENSQLWERTLLLLLHANNRDSPEMSALEGIARKKQVCALRYSGDPIGNQLRATALKVRLGEALVEIVGASDAEKPETVRDSIRETMKRVDSHGVYCDFLERLTRPFSNFILLSQHFLKTKFNNKKARWGWLRPAFADVESPTEWDYLARIGLDGLVTPMVFCPSSDRDLVRLACLTYGVNATEGDASFTYVALNALQNDRTCLLQLLNELTGKQNTDFRSSNGEPQLISSILWNGSRITPASISLDRLLNPSSLPVGNLRSFLLEAKPSDTLCRALGHLWSDALPHQLRRSERTLRRLVLNELLPRHEQILQNAPIEDSDWLKHHLARAVQEYFFIKDSLTEVL